MKAQLLHLSGPLRGETTTYPAATLLIGSDPKADVRLATGPPVMARHAEIRLFPEHCDFHLRRLDGQVFVNGKEVEEVILAPEDLLEFGTDGPQARFRIHTRPTSVCKPIRLMLGDAAEVHRHSGFRSASRGLTRDLLRHATPQLKFGVPLALILIVMGISYLGGRFGSAHPISQVETEFRRQEQARNDELGALRHELETFRSRQDALASRTEVDALRSDFARRAEVVDRLVESNAALTRVLEVYSHGVALIHGVFAFQMPSEGGPTWLNDSSGDRMEVEYVGSGFLASDDGWLITNRHVAQPWWKNDHAEVAAKLGFMPMFLHLEACFPNRDPVEIDPSTARLRADDIDVALLHVNVKDVPVLPLSTVDPQVLHGQRVIVLGYPTGVSALLAKTEPQVTKDVMAAAKDMTSLIGELAKRHAISPVATQGALNEVLDKQLVYDAGTTSGGSGGPVFGVDGKVVGVNFAILRDFVGSNFGVPIRFAAELFPKAETRAR